VEKQPKYLKISDLEPIKLWIKELKILQYQYKPKGTEDPRDWSKLKLPYNVIGSGRHRVVFDLKDGYVLKVAITLKGIKCNKREAETYKSAPASLKNRLTEVKEQGHGWIIMKKIDNAVPDTEENRKKIIRLQNEFIKNGIDPKDIVNRKKKPRWRNIRLSEEGQISVIDYGNFEKLRTKMYP
jgi:hypothetical protein